MEKFHILFFQMEDGKMPEYKPFSVKDEFDNEVKRFKETGVIHLYDFPTDSTRILKPLWIGIGEATERIKRNDNTKATT
ncbi:MAG TPA: hypothetical protein VIG80_15980 [Bacillaceae bacterium]